MLLHDDMNVAVKLDFTDLDDSAEDITDLTNQISDVIPNSDDCNNNITRSIVCSTPHVTPNPNGIRRLRPVPKSTISGVRRVKLFAPSGVTRSMLRNPDAKFIKSQLSNGAQDSPSFNINPFTPSGIFLSLRHKGLQHADCDMSTESAESGIAMNIPQNQLMPELENVSMDDIESNLSNSRRITIDGVNINRYAKEFIEFGKIGKGDFGGVFKCKHRLDGCLYAIKKSAIPNPGSFKERVALNDVYAHAVLGKHPHVVRYYSSWTEDDWMIIQNEYCNSGSLLDLVENKKRQNLLFTCEELKQILLHVAKGLRYIHSKQMVHLDLKPENIFIDRDCSEGTNSRTDHEDAFERYEPEVTYKIGDLGLATSLIDPKVEEGDSRYLAKEIIEGNYSQLDKADIFALGLTVYELARMDRLPKNGDFWQSLRNGNIPPIMGLRDDMLNLICLMCHPDPGRRPSATHLLDMIAQIHPVSKTHQQLQQEVKSLQCREKILSSHVLEAARYLQSINPSMAQNLFRIVQPSSPVTGATVIHEPYTPPREPSPAKQMPKIIRKGSTRINKRISPMQTRRQLSKRFKCASNSL